ncbi:hypothetical protein RIF29_24332 [Crotalaria pallida]|uniref:Pectinesterase n=1 Tax=Crotalaria pallida TaxID=3830 RepID=A0AAN9EK60_CROPI
MAFKNLAILKVCIFLLLSLLPLLPIVHSHAAPIVPPESICLITTNPSYCKNVIANKNGTIFYYARISIQKSLSRSFKFLNLVNFYLRDQSSLSQPTIRALEDCQFFAKRSFDDLSKTRDTIDKPGELMVTQVENVHTMLSAVLANQHTCLDGLETTASDEIVKNVLSFSLLDDTKLHGVSLDLFVKGWVRKKKKVITSWQHNQRKLKLSNQLRAINDYENIRAKTINKVIVCQDGRGDFTTINDAISAAPDNTSPNNGYFLIYIKAGIYQEYVHVPETKKYLMMIGAGINRTIITGDHNVPDGYTTFDSGTLAVLQNCNIYVRRPMTGQYNVIVAHGEVNPNANSGICIQNATIKAADDFASMVGEVKTYLGRPWMSYSKTIYLQSFIDNLIDPEGWIDSTTYIPIKGFYFAEYNNWGPGSNTKNRKSWPFYHVINANDAAHFTVSNFIHGNAWLPVTEIPFSEGLI